MAVNEPVSIMPYRAMFTTPLRSERIPPKAAKIKGVAMQMESFGPIYLLIP